MQFRTELSFAPVMSQKLNGKQQADLPADVASKEHEILSPNQRFNVRGRTCSLAAPIPPRPTVAVKPAPDSHI